MNLNLLPNSSHQSKDMPCIIWNTSMSVMMKLPWRYRVQCTNDYFLWLWSRCVNEFDPFNRSGLNAQSGAGSCNSCKSWRRRTTSSSCTEMKNFSLIPERMLTTWWVITAISAGQITGGYAFFVDANSVYTYTGVCLWRRGWSHRDHACKSLHLMLSHVQPFHF